MPWVRMRDQAEDATFSYCAGCTKKFERVGEIGYQMYDGTCFCVACAFMGFIDVLDEARSQKPIPKVRKERQQKK